MVSAKKKPLSLKRYKPFIGQEVKFVPRTRGTKKMIEKGFERGIIINVVRAGKNGMRKVLFEIDIGSQGKPIISHFLRRSFILVNEKRKQEPTSHL